MQIAIMGISGRMGKAISSIIKNENKGISFVGAGMESSKEEKFSNFVNSDVVIDFTSPSAFIEHADFASKSKTPIVIGTTGFNAEEERLLIDISAKIPVLYAANMSLGVNVILSFVEKAAVALDEEFDIEILEAHHKYKKDAPSGTALALGKAAAKGRDIENYKANYNLRGGERKTGAIGYSVIRGGDIVGEHKVIFAGAGERVEIAHLATDRKIFARGAVKAAKWLKDKEAGLYSMRHVLGL